MTGAAMMGVGGVGNGKSCSEGLEDELNEITEFVLFLGCSVPSDMLFCKSNFVSNVIYSLNVSNKQEAVYEGGELKWCDEERVQAQLGFDEGRWCVGKGGRWPDTNFCVCLTLKRGCIFLFPLVPSSI